MRENAVKKSLAAGGRAFGSMIFEFFTPGMPRLLKNAGAEYALYCMEHTGASYETLKPQFALCRALGVIPLVRVPGTEYDLIARALDCGALGVMVPLVDTAAQAEFIVSCTRYPPAGGRRGAAFGFAHDDYEGGDVVEKMKMIHERTLVIAMIETRSGLENVDAIAAVPGVDVLWLGHFDMSNFLGIPGQFSHPVFQDAIRRIVAAAQKHGKAAGYMAASAALGKEYLAHGFRMLATGTDQGMLQEATRTMLDGMRQ
ncbi:MAG: aldolase/citrate lyase family protein [Betaproteobacteria bacterium]|nr:aldolase/citrate lyase family protein [Betaproteobacteria bacterium]MDH5221703.1 aldolase/citrate lyase family protein [Betaproteobacteria bacterium]MDH5350858.1 aldolase/citrate lyase family protein [Betaproteobacteria bacterium]